MDQRVSLITLGVADLARAEAFYGRLGWRKAAESLESIAFYQLGGLVLALFPLDKLADDQGRPGVRLGTGAITLAHNLDGREAVDRAFAAAVSAGGTALKAPVEVYWGGYSGYFADPDGHAWELAFNPFLPLSDDGTLTLPSEAP